MLISLLFVYIHVCHYFSDGLFHPSYQLKLEHVNMFAWECQNCQRQVRQALLLTLLHVRQALQQRCRQQQHCLSHPLCAVKAVYHVCRLLAHTWLARLVYKQTDLEMDC